MSPERADLVSRWIGSAKRFVYEARWVLAAFVASRLVVFGVILLARGILVPGELWHPGGLLSVLGQFDAELWYMTIVRYGYSFSTTHVSPAPFFPFYPILVKLVSFVFNDVPVAAFIVSHSCLLGAGLLLDALIKLDYDDAGVSRRAVMFFMFGPASFFFSHAYTESTFLLLAIGAFYGARRGWWLAACVCGMLLSATRNVGVLIALPLLIEYVRQTYAVAGFRGLFHPRILLLGLVPLGLGAFMLFSYLKFNDPLAFVHASKVWGRHFTTPAVTFSTFKLYVPILKFLFATSMLTWLLVWTAGLFFRLRASYIVFSALLTAVYLCASSMEAWPRYLSVEFPLYIVMGLITTRVEQSYEPLLASSVALLTISTALSASGHWIT